MLITKIAQIMSGYSFRKGVENISGGQYAVIQMRDIEDYTRLSTINLSQVNDIQPKAHHLLQQGDILFIAKGANNYAISIDQSLKKETVAAANFLVLRVTAEHVLPAYLAWYINQSPAQTFLRGRSKGSYIPSISKTALSELEIPLLPLDLQNKIVLIHSLAERENELQNQIQRKRNFLTQTMLLKASRKGNE